MALIHVLFQDASKVLFQDADEKCCFKTPTKFSLRRLNQVLFQDTDEWDRNNVFLSTTSSAENDVTPTTSSHSSVLDDWDRNNVDDTVNS